MCLQGNVLITWPREKGKKNNCGCSQGLNRTYCKITPNGEEVGQTSSPEIEKGGELKHVKKQ